MKQLLIAMFALLPLLGISQSDLKLGDKIEARWKHGSTWYKGIIGEIKDTLFFINYDDGDTEWTTEEYIRKLGETKVAWPENTCSNKASLFKVGDQVDVEENGIWYDAKVLQVNGGQYYIHYDRYSSRYDCVVNNDRIRKWTGKKASSSSSGSSSSSSSGETASREISLENTCQHDVTMYVDDDEYFLRKGQSVDVTITKSVTIYTYLNGRKVMKANTCVDCVIWKFFSDCD